MRYFSLGLRTHRIQVKGPGTNFPETYSASEPKKTFSNARNGSPNPRWRDQVRKHQNASTSYQCSDMKPPKVSPGHYVTVTKTATPNVLRYSTWDGPLLYSGQALLMAGGDRGQAAAVQKFVRKANREIRAFQGLVSLGELNETLRMIRHPALALKEALRGYLRESPKKVRHRFNLRYEVLKELAPRGLVLPRRPKGMRGPKTKREPIPRTRAVRDVLQGLYLEYANGWAPLLKDIDGAMRSLAEHFTPIGEGYRKVVASAEQPVYTKVSQYPVSLDNLWWSQNDVETRKGSTIVRGEVRIRRDGSGASFRESAGLNLRSFVPTAWQLLPLSYVVDWFTNVGDALEVWAFNMGSVSWACMSRKYETTLVASGAWDPTWAAGAGVVSHSGYLGSLELARVELDRVPWLDTSVNISFSLPSGHLVSKLLNASSLYLEARRASDSLLRFARQ